MKKIVALLLLCSQYVAAQQKKYDSLSALLPAAKTDTQKLSIIQQLALASAGLDRRKVLEHGLQGIQLAERINDKNWMPKFYEVTGRAYINLLKLDSANTFLQKADSGYIAVNNRKGQATTSFLKAHM